LWYIGLLGPQRSIVLFIAEDGLIEFGPSPWRSDP
jgi:hypothetical protein